MSNHGCASPGGGGLLGAVPVGKGFHDVDMCVKIDSVASDSYPEFDSFFQEEGSSVAAWSGVGTSNSNSNQSQSSPLDSHPSFFPSEADSTIGTRLNTVSACSAYDNANRKEAPTLVEKSLEPLIENLTSTADEPDSVEGNFSRGIKRQRSVDSLQTRSVSRKPNTDHFVCINDVSVGSSFSNIASDSALGIASSPITDDVVKDRFIYADVASSSALGTASSLDRSHSMCATVSPRAATSRNFDPLNAKLTPSADDLDFDAGNFNKGVKRPFSTVRDHFKFSERDARVPKRLCTAVAGGSNGPAEDAPT